MKLPKTMKIGGRVYKVAYPFVFTDTTRPLYGLHDASGQSIKLAGKDEFGCKRHEDALWQTFIHEILHAIDNVYAGGKLLAHDEGEHITQQLAEGIYQVFNDNNLWRLR